MSGYTLVETTNPATTITIVEEDWKNLDLTEFKKLTKDQLIEQIGFYIAITQKLSKSLNGQISRSPTK